jgi:hypothetical protein
MYLNLFLLSRNMYRIIFLWGKFVFAPYENKVFMNIYVKQKKLRPHGFP